MKYQRDEYVQFLEAEYNTQMVEYGRLIATKALLLKERGEVFVGKFVRFKDGSAIFKVRVSDNMPRKNSFWTATCLTGIMGNYKNWGNYSWEELREQYQCDYADVHCAWLSKSEDPNICLVGIRNITLEFAEMLKSQTPVIAFGPKDPPLKYILNLKEIIQDNKSERLKDILDYDHCSESVWSPVKISAREDLNEKILAKFNSVDTIVIQGPPGTGKTYRMAKLITLLLMQNKSVLVTALTNEALKVLASKPDLKPFLDDGKITKTSLTIDEKRELSNLIPNEGNVCNAVKGTLSLATFYVASGWAKDVIEDIPFDYVIMDEASQALLPMIAATKKLGKKIVWIGDQKQLAPIIQTNEDVVNKRSWTSIVRGFSTVCDNIKMPQFMLSDSFRLTKRATDFTGLFYNNHLNSVAEIQKIKSNIPNINAAGGPVLIDMDLKIGDKKPENAIQSILNLVQNILKVNSEAKIAVLSKFKETIKVLQKRYIIRLQKEEIPDNVKIETVDGIQGLTVDYTIFFIPNASISYSLESELFNVATSRSKYCTFIIADKRILKSYMSLEVRKFFLKLNEDKMASFVPSDTRTLSSGDLKVRILGKIQLPERNLKEIEEDKENIFIIDTNVFVNYPKIISKIGKYKVVIPTTVLEELDRLKQKPNINKKALNDAAKDINKAFLNNFSKMEEGDISLLPIGFDSQKADCLILSVALKYKNGNNNPILLTSDNLLQSKALGLGIKSISLKEFLAERKT